MNLSALTIRYPGLIIVALVTVIVWGGRALWMLPRQEEPILTWRLANIITRYPGASPERVESLITDVLEQFVEEVDQVEHIYSVSRAGVSLLQVELSDEVTDAPPVWQKVRHKLTEAAMELPPEIVGPELDDEIMGTFAQLIAVTGVPRGMRSETLARIASEGEPPTTTTTPNTGTPSLARRASVNRNRTSSFSATATFRQLEDHAERLEDRLRYLPNTASTTLFGQQPEVIQVALLPAQLAVHSLSFEQVAEAIANRNTRLPSGRLRVRGEELVIETSGEFASEDELREMVLMVSDAGRTVNLDDVATVTRTTQDPPLPLARLDGQPAIVVGVRARSHIGLDAFGEQVSEVVAKFRDTLPPAVKCSVFHDLAGTTRQRTSQLTRTLWLSVAFVFLSTTLFMGWRGGVVVTSAIPVTGLFVLILFSGIGMPLNQMSVMAIIMAFGLLVDDAIVVAEQVHRRVTEGVPALQAAAEEPARLTAPLVVSTLTTIGAFLPIYLLPGGTGEFVRAIPVGVAVCLLAALLVAITFVPWMTSLLIVGAPERKLAVLRPLEAAFRSTSQLYSRTLERAIRRPILALTTVVLIMGLLGATGLTLRRDFFSPVQRDQFLVDVFAAQGGAVRHTGDIVAEAEAILQAQGGIHSVGSFIGRNAPLIFYNLESQETYANHFAQLVVRVDSWQNTAQIAQQVQQELRTRISGADCTVHILEHGAPFVAPFEVRIAGPALSSLTEIGRRVVRLLERTSGVRNVRTNYGNEALKLVAQVNEPVARRYGVDQHMVARQLSYRVDGRVASRLREGDEQIDINVRLPEADRRTVTDLHHMFFKPTPESRRIPLGALATLIPIWEPASIYRRDGQRTLSVLAYPEFGLTAAQVSRRFQRELAALGETLPAGYHLELGGENEQRQEAESNLMQKGMYAAGVIVFLLMAEFRSFRLCMLILAVIPLAFAGSMVGLWTTGWPLNFMAIMGMMMLMGIVVNDALILVDGFERRRKQGQALNEAVIAGTLERSRHVVITTVTTVAGFLPLALSPSLLWPPLAIAIIAGLSLATLLTLLGVPAAYALVYHSQSFNREPEACA